MKPEQLHRSYVTAIALREHRRAGDLRQQFGKHDHKTAYYYVMATCMVALEHRFGDIEETDLDHAELVRFLTELRTDFRHAEPPLDFLAIEALIRSIYGEDYLLEYLTGTEQDLCARILLFCQVDKTPRLREGLDDAITKAQKIIAIWLLD